MTIRLATRDDVPAVFALERRTEAAAHWSEEQYYGIFRDRLQRVFLVSEDGGAVSGFLVARMIGAECELENIAVALEGRRRGVGAGLISELLQRARMAEVTAVFLEVRETNSPARVFYRKLGFSEAGRRKNYYRDPDEDAILYRISVQ